MEVQGPIGSQESVLVHLDFSKPSVRAHQLLVLHNRPSSTPHSAPGEAHCRVSSQSLPLPAFAGTIDVCEAGAPITSELDTLVTAEWRNKTWKKAPSNTVDELSYTGGNRLLFRVKELQSCLEKLGLTKTGRKTELQQRILTYINQGPADSCDHWKSEAAGRIINQVHCEMRGVPYRHPSSSPSSSTHVAVATEQIPNGSSAGRSEASPSPASANTTIRCPCGIHRDTGSRMIQCGVADCGVWQHCHCVGIPPGPEMPTNFMCELCRLDRCDPFWFPTHKAMFAPTLLRNVPSRPPATLLGPLEASQRMDKTLELPSATARLIQQQPHKYRLQMVCLMMNDPVACRMHWPMHPVLQVNYTGFKPYPRNSNAKLGPAGRDEPLNLAGVCLNPPSSRNVISLEAQDPRKFCVTVQMAERRGVDEVKAMIARTESLPEALQRVQVQAVKDTTAAADEDDDIAVTSTGFSLKCPLSGSRMQTPARVVGTDGLVAFDLVTFLEIAKRTRKWVCPHSMKNFSVFELQVDAYMQRVLECIQSQPDIVEIEVSAEGQWRPAGSTDRWRDITEDVSTAAITGPVVKQELNNAPMASDSDSEEEMSEGEELRQAAAAMAVSKKRARDAEEIISLLSDSDDEPMPVSPSARHAANGYPQQPSRGTARPSAPIPAAGLRPGVPPPMPHIMPNPRWAPRPGPGTNAASSSLQKGTGVFSASSHSSRQPGSSLPATKAGSQSSGPPPTHASRSGGAAPGVGSLSSHFVRQGAGSASQQPSIPGLGPQSSQGPSNAWRNTLPAIFQRQQQQQQQQQSQMVQPAGSGEIQPHPASHGSVSGARSGAVAPSSSHGAHPTASSSQLAWRGGASASQLQSNGAAQPARTETTATTTRITPCPDNPLRLRIQKFPKPAAPASAPPPQLAPGSSAAGPGPHSPLCSTGTPTHPIHSSGYRLPANSHHTSPSQPTGLGPPPTHFGSAGQSPWMGVQYPMQPPQLQHLQYMPAGLQPPGMTAFQQGYHPGMYGGGQQPQLMQQQPYGMSHPGGWQQWGSQTLMPNGAQSASQHDQFQSSIMHQQQQQPQTSQQHIHSILQPASQPPGQPPFMDEITALLLAEDNPSDQPPISAQSSQPHQQSGDGAHPQGSQPLPGSDGGDELTRLLQHGEAPGASDPSLGNPQQGFSASGAAHSGNPSLPAQPTHSKPHPGNTASGSSTHSGLQGTAEGLQHGAPTAQPLTSGLQQKAGTHGQQDEGNGLDPDWTPPTIEGDPWEPSSAPSSSFGDFLNTCPFDFSPGNPDEVGEGVPGLDGSRGRQDEQLAGNDPQSPGAPPPPPQANGIIDLDSDAGTP
ncbi:hypothetical protein WJX74_010222 [Apatococcus lobatus]|uniref:SAP domain-containing protein n=1 Tax=Apatococcus lobatus TaxID=904363 RepID=A0AAW1QYY2_9CHLO